MIKRIQRKFILLIMSSLFFVLFVIITGINIANYIGVVRDSNEVLEILADNKGGFPHEDSKENEILEEMSPELPYESRYFSVLMDAETLDLVQIDISRISAVNTEEALEYAREALGQSREQGFLDIYRYVKKDSGEQLQIIFLDCSSKLESFWYFLIASISISFAGYVQVFVTVAFFSTKIVTPFSESYEKQKRFITDAGHEIKTPLTIINADVDVLEMEIGENEWLQDIQKQAGRLAALTNDLVYLARMEEEAEMDPMIEFPISDVVSEAASSFQSLAQTKHRSFQCEIQPMLSMKGNPKDINQLVSILMDNAIKYSPEGGSVSLKLEQLNRGIKMTVYNTTDGQVPKESLTRLFERFYRVDPSRNTSTGGYGIGLSVAKAIVEAHKGKIQAETEEGNVLKITVIFP